MIELEKKERDSISNIVRETLSVKERFRKRKRESWNKRKSGREREREIEISRFTLQCEDMLSTPNLLLHALRYISSNFI